MPDTHAPRASIAYCLHVIRASYLDSPGLLLSRTQIERLWGFDALTCHALLAALVDARFLTRTESGLYARIDAVPKGTGGLEQNV